MSIIDGYINGNVRLLISNNSNCGAVKYAIENNINYKIINDYRFPVEINKNNEYEVVLKFYKTDLILLAGFMKKIPMNIINIFKYKIMNVHPSLLPKYGGSGFYGMKVHDAVIQSRDKFSGATIHFVNAEYDKGPIIIQKKTKVEDLDNSFTLSKKVLKIEHAIYSKAVQNFCLDKIKINNNTVTINE